MRGGPWCLAHHGVGWDQYRATSSSVEGALFLESYLPNKSASFKLDLYGDALAKALAELWVAKMSYFYEIAAVRGPRHVFTEGELAGFREDPALEPMFAGEAPEVQARLAQVRGLRPVLRAT